MSIVPYHPLAAANEGLSANAVLLVLSAGSLGAGLFSGLLPPRGLPGPPRIAESQSAWPLAGVLFGGVGFYLFTVSTIASLWNYIAPGHGAATEPLDSDTGVALINTVPSVLGLVAVLVGDRVVYDAIRQELGLGFGGLASGFRRGVIAAALVLPPLYLTSQLMEVIYRTVHYEHPTEHPLLHVLGEGPSPVVKVTIIFGACVIAPVWEELLFRAHLQTLMVRAVQWIAGVGRDVRQRAVEALPSIEAQASPGTQSIEREPVPPAPRPAAWMSWLAIVVTSIFFAGVHPVWSFPVIFVLALCLGYVYERTGNLWASITLHAMFNIVSTALFLAGAGSN